MAKNINSLIKSHGNSKPQKSFENINEDIQVIYALGGKKSKSLIKSMNIIEDEIKEAHMFANRMSHPSQKKIVENDLRQAEEFANEFADKLS